MQEQPKPVRVQRTRQKKNISPNGLKTVYAGRPSAHGNPYKVVKIESLYYIKDSETGLLLSFVTADIKRAAAKAVFCFKEWYPVERADALRNKNISCWCKVGDPCHADYLIEISNK